MKLKSLRAALAPLTKFGQEEISFEVEGPEGEKAIVYLRPLLPREEVECQKRAREILLQAREEEGTADEDELSRAVVVEYFDKFRVEVISYALVQVGNQDFRGVKYVETEENLASGIPVKIPLHEALRGLISEDWSRGMITICWSKYGDLMTKIAKKAEKLVEQTVQDMDAEILRLTEKLTKLKAEREDRAKGDPSVTMDQIRAITNLGEALEKEVEETIQQAQFERDLKRELEKNDRDFEDDLKDISKEEPVVEPEVRRSVIPQKVPPPTAKPPPQEEFFSSFEDPDDPEALRRAEEAAFRVKEAQRVAKARSMEGIGNDMSKAKPIGQVAPGTSGKMLEAYRMPSETISSRGSGGNEKEEKPKGNFNPNFVPPRK